MKRIFTFLTAVAVLFSVCIYPSAEEELYGVMQPQFPGTKQNFEEASMSLNSVTENSLTEAEYSEIENLITNGWDNLAEEIDLARFQIPIAEFKQIYADVRGENPFYYYVHGGYSYYYNTNKNTITKLLPKYTETDKNRVEAYLEELNAATEEILFLIKDGMSDFDKIMTVHDYMVLNYQYDLDYEIYDISIMTKKKGVCQAYSYAFKHVMNCLGIDCTYVSSDEMNHVWNLVKVDGNWYHIDVTWDDPTDDKYGQVRHEYELLSTECIKHLKKPHYGFDLGNLIADSEKYHNSAWRNNYGEVVYHNGKTYWFDDNDLVSSDGSIIYKSISSNNKWNIGGGWYLTGNYAGLAEHNGKIYFNSHDTIFEYEILTEKIRSVHFDTGICGLFVSNNVLHYTIYDQESEHFIKGGDIQLENISVNPPHRENNKIVMRICNTSEKPLFVFAFNGNIFDSVLLEKQGVSTATFDIKGATEIFLWDENLHPLIPKKTVE